MINIIVITIPDKVRHPDPGRGMYNWPLVRNSTDSRISAQLHRTETPELLPTKHTVIQRHQGSLEKPTGYPKKSTPV